MRLLGVGGRFQDLGARNHKNKLRLDSHAEWALQEMGIEPDGRAIETVVEILRRYNGK